MRLAIQIGSLVVHAELAQTPTAAALAAALPFDSRAQTWGEEVYFATPVSAALEADCRQVVAPGTVCFWTEGHAIALPFGRTPISTDARPKLASPCNVLGKLVGDATALARVRPGEKIRVSLA